MPGTAVTENSHNVSALQSHNEHLLRWVEKMASLTKPESIHWVDGSQEEYNRLCDDMCATGTLIRLNQDLWPGCYYTRSDRHLAGSPRATPPRSRCCSPSNCSAEKSKSRPSVDPITALRCD